METETKLQLPTAEDTHAVFCVILGIKGHNEERDIALGEINVVQGGCYRCLVRALTTLLVDRKEIRDLINSAALKARDVLREQRERGNNQHN